MVKIAIHCDKNKKVVRTR